MKENMKNMYLQNLHTHTCYCDGADTPEEIILEALLKGFTSIGFSEHSFGNADKADSYKKEILRLKKKYKDDIKVFLGLEVDMYSKTDMEGYDYLIGSVHYLKCNEEFVSFDESDNVVEGIINKYFDGDGMKYAKAYYKALVHLPEYGQFDIIGHFDLITKHCDKREFFDVSSKEYINASVEAAETLAGKIPFFELNTGAIARGYRKTPYPSMRLIKELKRLGYGAVITSDCHSKDKLDYKFTEAVELLKSCGFKEKYVLTEQGFKGVSL